MIGAVGAQLKRDPMNPRVARRPRKVRGVTHAVVVLARGPAELAVWPLIGCRRPDLTTIDDLARWRLQATRVGCTLRLRGVSAELRGLLELAGLDESLQVIGEAEGGE